MLADQFLSFLNEQLKEFRHKNYLVAVSGGQDSMVLLHLFHTAKLNFSAVHCNFNLRGRESSDDEKFVIQYCNERGITIYSKNFDLRKNNKVGTESIQVGARRLRYHWFDSLVKLYGFDYICTAHHQKDNAETIIQRFFSGAYPESLQGIKPVRDNLVRPLLRIPHKMIVEYGRIHSVPFRTDSSNLSNNYTRNQIRHKIIPAIEEVFGNEMMKNLENVAKRYVSYYEFISNHADEMLRTKGPWYEINLEKLKLIKGSNALLYEIIKNYGFNWVQCEEICADLEREQGVYFENDNRTYKLFFGNGILQLVPVKAATTETSLTLIEDEEIVIAIPGMELRVKCISRELIKEYKPSNLYIDFDLVHDKIMSIRDWNSSDEFTPLGMKNKKSVHDFLKDLKLSPAEKQYCKVLCEGQNIVGVLGYRIDDSFKLTERSSKVAVFSSGN